MSFKLKLMRNQELYDSIGESQVEKASWIEILRRLREALELTFRFLSSSIDGDVENILSSHFGDEHRGAIEWTKVREKYVHLASNCINVVSNVNVDGPPLKIVEVIEKLKAVIDIFNRTKFDDRTSESTTTLAVQCSEHANSIQLSLNTNNTEPNSSKCTSAQTKLPSSKKSRASNKINTPLRNVTSDTKENVRCALQSGEKKQSKQENLILPVRQNSEPSVSTLIRQLISNTDVENVSKISDDPTSTSELQLSKPCKPLLIFDSHGNPLTDHNGVPLINMNRKLVIKYNNDKPVSHTNGEPIFDEYGLPFVNSFDKPLKDREGNPLRLFNQENIPLTDGSGMVLKLCNGSYAIVLDEFNRILGDTFGSPIFDGKGKILNGNMASRNIMMATPFESQDDDTCIMLYNEKGFLLTDKFGKPLKTAAGQPLLKFGSNGEITDIFGGPLFDENGKLFGNKAQIPYLLVYDCDKYPLANSRGEILHDVGGKPLLVCNPNGKPISDSENRVVYDSNGIPCNDPDFQAYSQKAVKPRKALFDFEIKIYNSKGRPLLDFDGSSLCNADGKPLIVTRGGKPFNDIEGNPLFDETGIPISQGNGTWLCPQGEPYRVFDCQGRPLTDKRGKDLYSVSGQCLLKLDKAGRPVFTYMKGHVCDSNGTPVFDPLFDPSSTPPNDELRMQVFVGNTPLKVFDRFGKPLSDSDGMALVDSQGICLIQFNEAGIPIGDMTGATIYDENRLPLGCSQNAAIISMNGLPFRLFNVHKRPLTDKNGYPLALANEKPLIKFDGVGRPISDLVGAPVLDFRGRNVASDPEARGDTVLPEVDYVVRDRFGEPLRLFDATGLPLTDASGGVLVNADGTHLRLNHHGEPVADAQGGPLFDQYGTPLEEVLLNSKQPSKETGESSQHETEKTEEKDAFGRPLKDSLGAPQFDSYGRPLYDLYRRHMFDQSGRPLSDATGRRQIDGRLEPTFKLPFDVRILSSAIKRSSVKKSNAGLQKDLLGGPLFDSDGIPLFNEHGKPIVDMYGRDLYDSQGQLQCDANGKPLSKQVKISLNGRTIVDVKDVVKMIRVPKEMIPMMTSSLVVGKRVADSTILPGSCIIGTNQKQTSSRCSKTYWALLRVTELSDGTLIHELLKALELDDIFENMAAGDHAKDDQRSVDPTEPKISNNPNDLRVNGDN